MTKLALDPATVRKARTLAQAGGPADRRAGPAAHHRLGRARDAAAGRASPAPTPTACPWVNRLLDAVRADVGLEHGVALPVWDALRARRGRGPDHARRRRRRPARSGSGCPRAATAPGPQSAAREAGRRRRPADRRPAPRARAAGQAAGATRRSKPWIYLIVATGDIYEDMPQAQAAAREGADVIAVIRSTGQSLLDYVPEGADARGLRRHLRHPGELPADAGRARRDQRGARPLRPADQLRLRPVHAGDRHAGRARAARHDAQRLDVRDPLPRHQPGAHLRRPALQPAGARPRRDHHQHRRGQLPHHRRRGRGRAHGHASASCSTSTSPRRPGSQDWQLGLGHAFEIDPDLPDSLPPRARPRAARPRAASRTPR